MKFLPTRAKALLSSKKARARAPLYLRARARAHLYIRARACALHILTQKIRYKNSLSSLNCFLQWWTLSICKKRYFYSWYFQLLLSLFWQHFLIYLMEFCILNILYPSNNTNCEWANTTLPVNTNVKVATTTTTAASNLEYWQLWIICNNCSILFFPLPPLLCRLLTNGENLL